MRKTIALLVVMSCGSVATQSSGPANVSAARLRVASGNTVVQLALAFVGRPYSKHGASPLKGFTDLGFVRYVYGANGVHLHVSAVQRVRAYRHLKSGGLHVALADLHPGDMVLFRNTIFAGLSHVGIYIGDGKFVHAEWFNRGVTVTAFHNDPVDGDYWAGKFVIGVRPTAEQ